MQSWYPHDFSWVSHPQMNDNEDLQDVLVAKMPILCVFNSNFLSANPQLFALGRSFSGPLFHGMRRHERRGAETEDDAQEITIEMVAWATIAGGGMPWDKGHQPWSC